MKIEYPLFFATLFCAICITSLANLSWAEELRTAPPSYRFGDFSIKEKEAEKRPQALVSLVNGRLSEELDQVPPQTDFILYLFGRLKKISPEKYAQQLKKLPGFYIRHSKTKFSNFDKQTYINFLISFSKTISNGDALELFIKSFQVSKDRMRLMEVAYDDYLNNNPNTFIRVFEAHRAFFDSLDLEERRNTLGLYCMSLRLIGKATTCLKKMTGIYEKEKTDWVIVEIIASHLSMGDLKSAKKMLLTFTPTEDALCKYSPPKDTQAWYYALSGQVLRLEKKFKESLNCIEKSPWEEGSRVSTFFKRIELARTYRTFDINQASQQLSLAASSLPPKQLFPLFKFTLAVELLKTNIFLKNPDRVALLKQASDLEIEAKKAHYPDFVQVLSILKKYLKSGHKPDFATENLNYEVLDLNLLFETRGAL